MALWLMWRDLSISSGSKFKFRLGFRKRSSSSLLHMNWVMQYCIRGRAGFTVTGLQKGLLFARM